MDKNKIRDFLSRTGMGMFLCWDCAAMVFLTVVAAEPFLGKAQTVVSIAALAILAVATLWYVAAFVVSLVKRQWMKASIMFFMGGVGAAMLAVGFGLAVALNFWGGAATWRQENEKPRMEGVPGENGETAFSVEYINAHPFLAEYDKTIVFKSGKRIGIWIDTGGAGPFAIYRLPTGEYYLVDGLKSDFIRNDYRVNVTNETVEMMCEETWVKIPDNALKVDSRSNDSISVQTANGRKRADGGMPVGDSIKGRSYIGLLHPSGRFESGEGDDPYADIIEPKWNPVKLDGGEVPFSLECRRWKGSRYYRLVFASGARIALGPDMCIREVGYSLCALEDGRYHLFDADQKDISWRNEWRIDATGESAEVMFKDHWNKYGDLWVKIPPGAISTGDIGISGGEDGKPLSVSIDVNTEGGKVTGHDFTTVGETLANEKFIGTFHPPDDVPRARQRGEAK